MKEFAGFAVSHNRANWDEDSAVFAISAVALIAFAVQPAACAEFWVEAELQQSVQLAGCFHADRAASSSIATGRAATRDKFLAAESGHSVAAVTALYQYFGSI